MCLMSTFPRVSDFCSNFQTIFGINQWRLTLDSPDHFPRTNENDCPPLSASVLGTLLLGGSSQALKRQSHPLVCQHAKGTTKPCIAIATHLWRLAVGHPSWAANICATLSCRHWMNFGALEITPCQQFSSAAIVEY